MKLCKPVKDFIETSELYINDNNFLFLYNDRYLEWLTSKWEGEYTGEFTYALLESNIDPLAYMKIVPPLYMYGTSYTAHFLPANIERIEHSAFDSSAIEEIDCGTSCKKICQSAFGNCTSLWRVIIHPSLQSIETEAFYGANDLKELTYLGTKDEWLKIHKQYGWNRGAVNLHTIICTDGEIDI